MNAFAGDSVDVTVTAPPTSTGTMTLGVEQGDSTYGSRRIPGRLSHRIQSNGFTSLATEIRVNGAFSLKITCVGPCVKPFDNSPTAIGTIEALCRTTRVVSDLYRHVTTPTGSGTARTSTTHVAPKAAATPQVEPVAAHRDAVTSAPKATASAPVPVRRTAVSTRRASVSHALPQPPVSAPSLKIVGVTKYVGSNWVYLDMNMTCSGLGRVTLFGLIKQGSLAVHGSKSWPCDDGFVWIGPFDDPGFVQGGKALGAVVGGPSGVLRDLRTVTVYGAGSG
jgi:hypothetical protein